MFDMQINVHICELVDDSLNLANDKILSGMFDIQIDVQFVSILVLI